jgi:hypothetical protein
MVEIETHPTDLALLNLSEGRHLHDSVGAIVSEVAQMQILVSEILITLSPL